MITPETYKSALVKTEGQCAYPGCSFRSVELHHIIFKSQGGSDSLENLIPLCPKHHKYENSPHTSKYWRAYYLKTFVKDISKCYATKEEGIEKRESKRHLYKKRYKSQLNAFKKAHNGLTPFQYKYNQYKKCQKKKQNTI